MFKKRIAFLLAVVMVLSLALGATAGAVDASQTYEFSLTAAKSGGAAASSISLEVGDELTVTLTLTRTDASAGTSYAIYAAQDEIAFDNRLFELVGTPSIAANGFEATVRDMGDGTTRVYMNFYSAKADGDTYSTVLTVGSFKLRAKAVGTTAITNENTAMSNKIGSESYATSGKSVTATIAPKGTESGGTEPSNDTVRVSFRLVGATIASEDVDFEAGVNDSEYVTWIATRYFTLPAGSSNYELFMAATQAAGISSRGADRNYVSTINAPAVLGGYALSEMANGPRSGWMYTVNGKHVGFGLKEQILTDGDVVIWHYVNDFAYEVQDWFAGEGDTYGDASTWSLWLKAADRDPTAQDANDDGNDGTDGGGGGGGGNDAVELGADETPLSELPELSVNLEPNASVSDGSATVSVPNGDITKAIDDAIKGKKLGIAVTPSISGTVDGVTVEITRSAAKELADAELSLIVNTALGNVSYDAKALGKIAADAAAETVKITIRNVKNSELSAVQVAQAGDRPVVELSVVSGGTAITYLSGGRVTVSLPYTLRSGERASGITVFALAADGRISEITCKYNETTQRVEFAVSNLSKFIIGYFSVWTNTFSDVAESNWFYDAVEYVASRELMNGVSATEFAPNASLTRAMLVTILHRYESEPNAAGGTAFNDVADGVWYSDAIAWASANGIVNGVGDGKYNPSGSITREQFATIMYRYAGSPSVTDASATDGFADAGEISSYATDAMRWAVATGLLRGREGGLLAPKGTASRAEAATIFMRYFG